MALHAGSVMGGLGVRVACVYELFIAITMNVLFASLTRDSSPTRAKNARRGSGKRIANTSSGSVPKLNHY